MIVCNMRGFKCDRTAGVRRSSDVRLGTGALRVWGLLLVLTALALQAGGCSNLFRPVGWDDDLEAQSQESQSPFKVVPRKSNQLAALNADDIVRIMQRIGFQDEQILELGTDLHNALRFSGAASVTYKKRTIALFAAEGDYVHIRSRSASFDYQISKGQFVNSALR